MRLTSFEHDIVGETWFCGWKSWDFESQTFWYWCLVLMSGIYKITCLPIIHISELKHRMLKFEVWKKCNFCQFQGLNTKQFLENSKFQDLPTDVCPSEPCPAIWLDKRYTQPHPPHPISSPPSWKKTGLLFALSVLFFLAGNRVRSHVDGSESKFDILYCNLATPWRLWFWHFAI